LVPRVRYELLKTPCVVCAWRSEFARPGELQVELKLMEFRLAMEERGFDDEEIEVRVAEVRKKLENEEMKVKGTEPKMTDTHALAEAKGKETKKFGAALGIRDDRVEGESFDRELQEQRKMERQCVPQPSTLNPQPSTLNPQPSTPNPEP